MHGLSNHLFSSRALAVAGLLALSSGCSCGDNIEDNGVIDPDAPEVIDANTIDAPQCDTPAPGTVGGACSMNVACATDNDAGGTPFCLNDALQAKWPAEGFCTIFCQTDDQCDANSTCALLPDPNSGGTFGACMPRCCDAVDLGQSCEPGRMCENTIFGEEFQTEGCIPGTPGAVDGEACVGFEDCGRNGFCNTNPFSFPGGECQTLNCAGDEDCAAGGDGRCVSLPDGVAPLCVDSCDTDADCREDEGYRCIDRGGAIGKYCQHPAPGDACTDDLDCGLASDPWSCREGALYPGGYCTVEDCDPDDNNTCPIFSFCVKLQSEPDTFCADRCLTAGGNECGAGYDCVQIEISTGNFRNVCTPSGETVELPNP